MIHLLKIVFYTNNRKILFKPKRLIDYHVIEFLWISNIVITLHNSQMVYQKYQDEDSLYISINWSFDKYYEFCIALLTIG